MGLITSYSDANLVLEEGLTVTYSRMKISGSWGWVSANLSGTYYYANEYHRYATKAFRYVGMTYAAAKTCRDKMVDYFTRTVRTDVWDDSVTDGQWLVKTLGSQLMTEITLTHDDACMYSVHVRVHEDDVRYTKEGDAVSPESMFTSEQARTYGSDAHGAADETEA
jgi:hypothetical protein